MGGVCRVAASRDAHNAVPRPQPPARQRAAPRRRQFRRRRCTAALLVRLPPCGADTRGGRPLLQPAQLGRCRPACHRAAARRARLFHRAAALPPAPRRQRLAPPPPLRLGSLRRHPRPPLPRHAARLS
eukprot:scaffold98767_cov63-Phaeocystis_antarctica.AAC.1